MPTISMFYGIVILMLFEDNDRHLRPHVHTRYQGATASVAIDDASLLEWGLPHRQLRLVGLDHNSGHAGL